jgi:hypothetical protein
MPAGLRRAIEARAPAPLGLEPAIGDEAGERGARLAVVHREVPQQHDQIGEEHAAAARQDGVAENGDDERAGADRLARGKALDEPRDRIAGAERPCSLLPHRRPYLSRRRLRRRHSNPMMAAAPMV